MSPIVLGGDFVDTSELGEIVLSAHDIKVVCEAIAIRISGSYLLDPYLADAIVLIKELFATGHGARTVVVKTTATSPPSSVYELYRPATHLEVLDANIGMPQIVTDDLGECTDVEALARARQLLGAESDRSDLHDFTISAEIPAGLPYPGDTVQALDTVGVCEESVYSWDSGGSETLRLSVVDYA